MFLDTSLKDSQRKAIHAKRVTAKLSHLAEIPHSVLKEQWELAVNKDDKIKLQRAMNLRTMRGMSNNPRGMFGMKNY